MDNETLESILRDAEDRKFWLKPWGSADDTNETDTYDRMTERLDFNRRPIAVKRGDVLLAYRIGISKLNFICECASDISEATQADVAREGDWRDYWRYSITAHNLTPNFGRVWSQHGLRPRDLADDFNRTNPTIPQTPFSGSYVRVRDKLRIQPEFAKFVIRNIMHI